MARSIWKGHISFGLVQIPVGLYPATQDADLSFHMLDRRDHSPIGYKKINKNTGEEVSSEDIVKAIEWSEGEYVELSEDDFAKANVEATQSIDIFAFVEQTAIEPRWFVKPYYVAPTKRSTKAYALLREVMRRTGKVALAKVVLRTRQYVAALLVVDDVLVLELLRYAWELRRPTDLDVPTADLAQLNVSARELQMAEQLVHGLSDQWQPEQYRDDFHDDLQALIEEKARTGTVTPRHLPEEAEGAEVLDIMSLLKRSIEATTSARAGPPERIKPGKTYAPKAEPDAEVPSAPRRTARRRKSS